MAAQDWAKMTELQTMIGDLTKRQNEILSGSDDLDIPCG
jgi:hypothetical protein